MKCCKGAEPYTFRGKINISGCGAVGSARGSGLRGRQFESGHPDHSRRKNKENLFSLFDRRKMERFCESKKLTMKLYLLNKKTGAIPVFF